MKRQRRIGRCGWGIVVGAAMLWVASPQAFAANDAHLAVAADKAVIAFMAVCALERNLAVAMIDTNFDRMSNIAKDDLPEGILAGVLLTSSAGTVRVTNDKTKICAMVVGPVDGARLQQKLRDEARAAFTHKPHGRFCEVDVEFYEGDAGSVKKMYIVNDPIKENSRSLLDATVWDQVKASGVQAMITMMPTRRDCPQS